MSVNITTNWTVRNGLAIESPLHVINDDGKAHNFDFENVCLENCIEIAAVDSKDLAAKLNISCTGQIKEVVIASEAKRLEVHDGLGEYLSTVQGEIFDDFEGIKVYVTKIPLTTALSNVLISFPSGNSSCWIFSVQVTVIEGGKSPHLGSFDMSNVNSLLQNSSAPLSKNANNFKKIFENFQSNPVPGGSLLEATRLPQMSDISGPPQMSDISGPPQMSDISGLSQMSDISGPPKMSDLLGNPLLLQSLVSMQAPAQKTSPDPQSELCEPSQKASLEHLLQKYIDKKFQDLEIKIMQRIDVLEKNQNKKFDSILERLDGRS